MFDFDVITGTGKPPGKREEARRRSEAAVTKSPRSEMTPREHRDTTVAMESVEPKTVAAS